MISLRFYLTLYIASIGINGFLGFLYDGIQGLCGITFIFTSAWLIAFIVLGPLLAFGDAINQICETLDEPNYGCEKTPTTKENTI